MIGIGSSVVRKIYPKWSIALIVGVVVAMDDKRSRVKWSDTVNSKTTWIDTEYLVEVDSSKIVKYPSGNLIKVADIKV